MLFNTLSIIRSYYLYYVLLFLQRKIHRIYKTNLPQF